MKNPQRLTSFWIFLTFLVWIFAFRGFLTSKFWLISDAQSYYDHTKFFIENLRHGVYPLWDPFWYFGAPNDFFLRRIGAFNPFYLIILFFKSLGIPYTLSYLCFLALYYWSGMIAFYLLAMRIYQDRLIAYAGYLILLFSALGTRLFDSYMMLVTVPLIWFFYFLVAFSQTSRKHFFLGMALSLMILLGTYIPIYFLIILTFFVLLFSLIYLDQVPGILNGYVGFFNQNRILIILSLIALLLSVFPSINFLHDTAHGQVALPLRHGDTSLSQTLTVPHQTLDWGAVEDLMYSAYFSNLKLYKFAVVYVPFFSVILLFLGFIGRINRRAVLIFLLGVLIFCCIVPHGLPFYDFLYKHVFFLKYFRNLHFFIWFFLIPLFVLLALEHWKMFVDMLPTNHRSIKLLLIYIWGVHWAAFLFVWWLNDAVISTYIMIFLSLILCSLMLLKRLQANFFGFALLTLTVLVQPLETYHYLSLKSLRHEGPYQYDFSYTSFKFNNNDLIKKGNFSLSKDALYYVSGAYDFAYQNISNYSLKKYLQNKILLVDHLLSVDRNAAAPLLERNFQTDANAAVIFNTAAQGIPLNGDDPYPKPTAQHLDENSRGFKLLAFDANHLRFSLEIPYKKFLVYNDCYDPYWRVSINHAPAPLYEANGAFKGVWVPAGHQVIEFSYGCWRQYAMNLFASIGALILLIGTIYYACFP